MEIGALVHYVGVYLWYYLGSCLRYFAVAGAMYGIFHLWFRREWLAHRIQASFPARGDVAHEIRSSMWAMACSGLASIIFFGLIQRGSTQMYFDVAQHGWGYFAFSILLGIVGYDAWFYWQHRLLHTPWWFRRAHQVHHHATNPTPFANFAHHWIEISLGNAFFIGFVLVVPMHPVAYGLVSMFIFGWGMVAHLGYELYPAWFAQSRAFGWINSATHHNMHHSHVGCNYGMFFNFWDRAMATNHPEYRATFDAVKTRPRAEEPYRVAVGA